MIIMKIKAPLLLSKYECSCTVSIQILGPHYKPGKKRLKL